MSTRLGWSGLAVVGVMLMAAPTALSDHTGPVTSRTEVDAPRLASTSISAAGEDQVDWAALQPGDAVAYDAYVAAVGEPAEPVRPSLGRQKASAKGDRIVVPALGTALPLRRAPVRDGVMQVPEGVTAAGWLTTSVRPGAKRGVTVLATHRDTGGGGRGTKSPLWDAERLKTGTVISIRWRGEMTAYKVRRTTWHKADRLPNLLDRTGSHRLMLITCGGDLVMGRDGRLHWSKRAVIRAIATR